MIAAETLEVIFLIAGGGAGGFAIGLLFGYILGRLENKEASS